MMCGNCPSDATISSRHFRFDEPLIGRILHQPERAWVRIPPRMDLASKNPPGGPNCDARHDATDILTDTSPAFRPLFAHGLRQRSPVNRSARVGLGLWAAVRTLTTLFLLM